ncbi:ABC transporter ATP-binding protein [Streptococcus sp. CSL10205-OR2]|uniref:ABC transporter ATP-binding protein n=1 Tax=Streptococcus sp. CSL10205-OR2 TaxID=2980558 RepID=UPI0021D9FAFE|nr:ABC transporter ATP-binding protein [Streptococcus sp. CSL10205-OR2]MCU9533680.1 ABC transporter ATP-binding protein/permease [Streptococcus sp. CSL10205-OR2]
MELLKRHVGRVSLSILMAILGVAFGVLPYFAIANIINYLVIHQTDTSYYFLQIGLILLGFLGNLLCHEISTIMSHHLAYKVIEEKRQVLADKLASISMGDVERRSSGEWTHFMVETLDKMEKPIAHVIPEVIANILIPVILVSIIFILDWRIGIANLLTVPLGFLFSMLMMRGYEEKSKRYQDASKKMNTTMVEYVQAIKVIKAFNKSASSFGKFKETVNEHKRAMLDWYLSVCFSATATMEVIPATMVFVLPTALFFFMKDEITVGTLITCLLLSYASYKPLLKAMSHLETIANIKVIIDEIDKVMTIPDLERGIEEKRISHYDISFKGVTFSYDLSKKVLNQLSFKANENELTAIVGYSGSGKSTIAKLLAGFWNSTSGDILIGGQSINNMPLSQNMALVTYVSQENFLFNKTILDNLLLAKEDASMEEIKEACQKASCHDFIMALPNGYDTLVGEGGANLSGGEKQRIALARSFLKNSPIIVLDEATAYADPDNEAIIQASINQLIKNKTVIMIAHRLSTIVNANKIIVVDEGQVVEEGTHQELLELNGNYKEMWHTYMDSKEIEVV